MWGPRRKKKQNVHEGLPGKHSAWRLEQGLEAPGRKGFTLETKKERKKKRSNVQIKRSKKKRDPRKSQQKKALRKRGGGRGD